MKNEILIKSLRLLNKISDEVIHDKIKEAGKNIQELSCLLAECFDIDKQLIIPSWKLEPATDKQLKYVKEIASTLGINDISNIKTKGDAYEFIYDNKDEYDGLNKSLKNSIPDKFW